MALPSGSSPAENPPGNMMICDSPIALRNSCTDSRIPSGVMLRKTRTRGFAPALSKAAAESYSQLVPGKTGMNTVGCAILCAQIWTPPFSLMSKSGDATSSHPSFAFVGNTLSRGFFQVFKVSSKGTSIPL